MAHSREPFSPIAGAARTHAHFYVHKLAEAAAKAAGTAVAVDTHSAESTPAEYVREAILGAPVDTPDTLRFDDLMSSGILPPDFAAAREVAMRYGVILAFRPVNKSAAVASSIAEMMGVPTEPKGPDTKVKSDQSSGMVRRHGGKHRSRRGSLVDALMMTKGSDRKVTAPLDITAAFISSLKGRIQPPTFSKVTTEAGTRYFFDIQSVDGAGSIHWRLECAAQGVQDTGPSSFLAGNTANIPQSFLQPFFLKFLHIKGIPLRPEAINAFSQNQESMETFMSEARKAWKRCIGEYISFIFSTEATTIEGAQAEIQAKIESITTGDTGATASASASVDGTAAEQLPALECKLAMLEDLRAKGKGFDTLFTVLDPADNIPFEIIVKGGRIVVTDLDVWGCFPCKGALTPGKLELLQCEANMGKDHTLPATPPCLNPHNPRDYQRILTEVIPLELVSNLKGVGTRLDALLITRFNQITALHRRAREEAVSRARVNLRRFLFAMSKIEGGLPDISKLTGSARVDAVDAAWETHTGELRTIFSLYRSFMPHPPVIIIQHGPENANPGNPSPMGDDPAKRHLICFPDGDFVGLRNASDLHILCEAIVTKWDRHQVTFVCNPTDKVVLEHMAAGLHTASETTLQLTFGALFYKLHLTDQAWTHATVMLARIEKAASPLLRELRGSQALRSILRSIPALREDLDAAGAHLAELNRLTQALPTAYDGDTFPDVLRRESEIMEKLLPLLEEAKVLKLRAQRLAHDATALSPVPISKAPPVQRSVLWGVDSSTVNYRQTTMREGLGHIDRRVVGIGNILVAAPDRFDDEAKQRILDDYIGRIIAALDLAPAAAAMELHSICDRVKAETWSGTTGSAMPADHTPLAPLGSTEPSPEPVRAHRPAGPPPLAGAACTRTARFVVGREKASKPRPALVFGRKPDERPTDLVARGSAEDLPSAVHALETSDVVARRSRAALAARQQARKSAALMAGTSPHRRRPQPPKQTGDALDAALTEPFGRRSGGAATRLDPRLGEKYRGAASTVFGKHRRRGPLAAAGASSLGLTLPFPES